jgi:hypothetical protein
LLNATYMGANNWERITSATFSLCRDCAWIGQTQMIAVRATLSRILVMIVNIWLLLLT